MRLLLGLALLATLLVAGDRFVADQAEARAAQAASDALGVPVEVELRGFPFMAHLLRGTVPEAVLTARDVPVPEREGGHLPLLRVLLRDVRLDPRAVAAGQLPPAAGGSFHAEAGPRALAAIAGLPREAEVVIGQGELRFTFAGREVRAVPEASGGRLVLRPADPALAAVLPQFSADLSVLPGGPAVRSVRAVPGLLLIEGDLARLG